MLCDTPEGGEEVKNAYFLGNSEILRFVKREFVKLCRHLSSSYQQRGLLKGFINKEEYLRILRRRVDVRTQIYVRTQIANAIRRFGVFRCGYNASAFCFSFANHLPPPFGPKLRHKRKTPRFVSDASIQVSAFHFSEA